MESMSKQTNKVNRGTTKRIVEGWPSGGPRTIKVIGRHKVITDKNDRPIPRICPYCGSESVKKEKKINRTDVPHWQCLTCSLEFEDKDIEQYGSDVNEIVEQLKYYS
jgi:DNA-directed RNA polymerase subunit RPC12/RpoP